MTNRRELLGTVATLAGGILATPSVWVKPIVNSVILPGHAQTSPIEPPPPLPSCESAPSRTQQFSFNGSNPITFQVPSDVCQIDVIADGAGGGGQGELEGESAVGGAGEHVIQNNILVVEGETLNIYVGQGGEGITQRFDVPSPQPSGGDGYSPGEDGNTTVSDTLIFHGAGGGGSSAIIRSGGEVLVEASGGGGASIIFTFLTALGGDGGGPNGGTSNSRNGGDAGNGLGSPGGGPGLPGDNGVITINSYLRV